MLESNGILTRISMFDVSAWLKRRSWGFRVGLFLAPFVFYYFIHDVYYYTILLNRHGL